jgi:hypothetical protein
VQPPVGAAELIAIYGRGRYVGGCWSGSGRGRGHGSPALRQAGNQKRKHAGNVADLQTCDQHREFKKRAQQAVPEISETRDNHCQRERKRRARTRTLKNRPRIAPSKRLPIIRMITRRLLNNAVGVSGINNIQLAF